MLSVSLNKTLLKWCSLTPFYQSGFWDHFSLYNVSNVRSFVIRCLGVMLKCLTLCQMSPCHGRRRLLPCLVCLTITYIAHCFVQMLFTVKLPCYREEWKEFDTHVHTCEYIYVHSCTCLHGCMHSHMCMHARMHSPHTICENAYIPPMPHVHMHTCAHIHVHVTYLYICAHTCTLKQNTVLYPLMCIHSIWSTVYKRSLAALY